MEPSRSAPVTPERLMQLSWGFAPPLIIEAAIHHGVFDHLETGAKTVEEVAGLSGASVRGLRAIMDALTGLQLLEKTGGRYRLAPEAAEFLVSGRPKFRGTMFLHSMRQLLPNWMQLREVVQSGRPVHREGTDSAQFFANFVEGLFAGNFPAASKLAEALGVQSAELPVRVLDIAAGSGVWGVALARRSPQVRVTAVDWPTVAEITRKMAAKHGVIDRFDYIEGDMHAVDFGTGYQIATLGHIVHGEGEAGSRALLKKTFDALSPGGTIVIAEFLVDEERAKATHALLFAVNMLVGTEAGGTFSFGEISNWLVETGFRNVRQLEVPGPSPLILADR